MSTSIYKPLELSILATIPDRRQFYRPEVRKVKRALFEREDNAATQKFIDEELEKITVTQSRRWNFNFKTEKTLDPDGMYKWRPVTPRKTIKPIHRPMESDAHLEELYATPDDIQIIRPLPQKPAEDQEMNSPPKFTVKSQRPITEFMSVRKKPIFDLPSKKSLDRPSSAERPAKVPRLSDLAS